MSSRFPWLCWRCPFRGELASVRCRCTSQSFLCFFLFFSIEVLFFVHCLRGFRLFVWWRRHLDSGTQMFTANVRASVFVPISTQRVTKNGSKFPTSNWLFVPFLSAGDFLARREVQRKTTENILLLLNHFGNHSWHTVAPRKQNKRLWGPFYFESFDFFCSLPFPCIYPWTIEFPSFRIFPWTSTFSGGYTPRNFG